MNNLQPPSVIFLMKRGFGYAFTSALSLVSGYLIKNNFNFKDVLLIGIHIFLSFPFFVAYSICFNIEKINENYNGELVEKNKNEAIILSVIITALSSIILLAAYRIQYEIFPSSKLFFSILIYSAIFLSYGYYIFKKYRDQSHELPKIRHHLIWPVVLSIAFSFYFGLYFNEVDYNSPILIPVYILIAYFVLSEISKISKRQFLAFGLALFFIASGISALGILKLEYLYAIIFSVTISGYLAIFESWSITHQIAKRESSGLNKKTEADNISPQNEILLSKKYYLATFAAIIIAGMMLPFQFIFSNSGKIFLIGYFFHSIYAFIIWYRAGEFNEKLIIGNWKLHKTIVGLIFLLIIVIDSKFSLLPNNTTTPGYVSFAALSILFTISILVLRKDISDAFKERETGLSNLFNNRFRFILLVPVICFIMCILILLLKDYQEQPFANRSNQAYTIYISYIVIILFFLIGNMFDWWNKLKIMLSNAWGIFLLTRIFTSLAIGLFVFIPAFYLNVGVKRALLWSVPFFLAAAGGFSLNDYFDVQKDSVNKPRRAIPSGKISKATALILGIILLITSGIMSFIFAKEWTGSALQLAAIVGVILYNPLVKKIGAGKTVFTAVLCTLPIVFIIKELNYPQIYWTLPFAVYCFINARELLMDSLDIKGDKLDGINTLPMKWGLFKTTIVSYVLLIIACLLILPIPFMSSNNYKIAITAIIYLAIIIIMAKWWHASNSVRRHLVKISWIPMGFSLLLLL